ncbi:MAG: sigma-54-dependent Fis family transcriptional regulator [Gemmatimonadetes bacterium]|nr:MAG: sigma-54-dependent Fis family transcriptional regulator [Gemmatimonadota bacterium]
MKKPRILVVDDDYNVRKLISLKLETEGYEVISVTSGQEAWEKVQEMPFNLIITDIMMPEMTGDELRQKVNAYNPNIPLIMITAYGSISHAVEALKNGANDYITKPFQIPELLTKVRNAVEKQQLQEEVQYLRDTLEKRKVFDQIIGRSSAIEAVLSQVHMVARSRVSIVIEGESGTGKELLARAIHYSSNRADAPFVAVSCGALPEELLENELFGHVKGAYTGAHGNAKGLFEEAHTGTIFLDEIGEINHNIQVKLLRVLQEQEFKPVGTTHTVKVDVRVLAATNRRLKEMVAKGTFREDLYYRLNVMTITVPPLRDRKEDIPLLAEHFLKIYRHQFEKDVLGFTPEAIQKLMAYEWPGNVRELENKIQQALLMTRTSYILPENIPLYNVEPIKSYSTELRPFQDEKKTVVDAFERNYITRALKLHHGNITHAAKAAGKDRKDFWRIMKKHNIDAKKFKNRP